MNPFLVFAHEETDVGETIVSLGDLIRSDSIKFTLIAAGILLFLLVVSHLFKEKNIFLKKILFFSIIFVITANTIYLVGSTLFLNLNSLTGGPIHYHADLEIYNCGKEIIVKHSEGLSNKVGTDLTHVHDDKRMHIEGAILDNHELTLVHFFESINGILENGKVVIPTDNGDVILQDGNLCQGGKEGQLNIYLYKTDGRIYTQTKLENYTDYKISPYSQVPPGDCIILSFDSDNAPITDKMCLSYKVAKEAGKIHGN